MNSDLVNGLFESIGGIMVFFNCSAIWKDKEVKGINLFSTAFFTSWGYWNLYYYPSLNQWWSFWGGVFIVLGNTLWITLAIYYTQKNKSGVKNEKNQL